MVSAPNVGKQVPRLESYWGQNSAQGGGHIDIGADPVGVSICVSTGIDIGVTLSCLHNILKTSGWILTKFSWIYKWDITKN